MMSIPWRSRSAQRRNPRRRLRRLWSRNDPKRTSHTTLIQSRTGTAQLDTRCTAPHPQTPDMFLLHMMYKPMTPASKQRCRSDTCQQHTIRTKAHSRPTGTDPTHSPRTPGSMTPLAPPSDTDPQHTSARRGTHDPTYASAPQTCTGPPDTQTSAWSSPDPTTHLEISSPTRFRGTLSLAYMDLRHTCLTKCCS